MDFSKIRVSEGLGGVFPMVSIDERVPQRDRLEVLDLFPMICCGRVMR
jgi:hypothetical protein